MPAGLGPRSLLPRSEPGHTPRWDWLRVHFASGVFQRPAGTLRPSPSGRRLVPPADGAGRGPVWVGAEAPSSPVPQWPSSAAAATPATHQKRLCPPLPCSPGLHVPGRGRRRGAGEEPDPRLPRALSLLEFPPDPKIFPSLPQKGSKSFLCFPPPLNSSLV